ncbi:sigma E protease regulator RseP [Sansalvadorimonas verongulae]|uniref:sigma E protease regulator RseP n=1 Tax=Sansalvadorimonas verongulae TaxID=2172824 RepID=UPI0012BCAC5C|nr:sigma E protease regulator RseP [Sansalvadorimonas verongulae]MTI14250.1 sigma E protease regulator RseP [Sansalvadorimonas verongulae]
MDSIQTIFAFIVTLGLLVSIHEYGHFWVARRCGIKVIRFSVGFGKPLLRWHDKLGTEYVIALIPLGGYVKMLDEREDPVAEHERHMSFNSKPVLSRIAVVAAGPVANFLLAIVALWLMYMIGVRAVIPVVGDVLPDSPAARAGLMANTEITSVDGDDTRSWNDVNMALLKSIGDTKTIDVVVRPFDYPDAPPEPKGISVSNWLTGDEQPSPVHGLGIVPWSPDVPAVIGQIVPGQAAERAGLQTGDKIIAMNGAAIPNWEEWVKGIRNSFGKTLDLTVERNGQGISIDLIPGEKSLADGTKIGYIGAGSGSFTWPEDYVREIRFGPVAALGVAAQDTASLSYLMVDSLRKMITGLVSVSNLSGPITIARAAGASIKSGLESFLSFLAMLSVSLGVINLLPVPVLDGGHLLYHFVELIRGKPLSEKAQMFGMKIGLALILGVMFVAIFNDLSRL